jgi:hypothetical protein
LYLCEPGEGIVDAKAHSLEDFINKNQHVIPDQVSVFQQEMSDIGLSQGSTFLVLGPEASIIGRHFNNYFRKYFPNNRAVFHRHYSS